MHKVIKRFHNLHDHDKVKGYHEYNVDDVYPREGYETSEDRIAELSGDNNAQGTPLIAEVEEEPAENAQGTPEKKNNKKDK